jgi:hypothetical protein
MKRLNLLFLVIVTTLIFISSMFLFNEEVDNRKEVGTDVVTKRIAKVGIEIADTRAQFHENIPISNIFIDTFKTGEDRLINQLGYKDFDNLCCSNITTAGSYLLEAYLTMFRATGNKLYLA